MVDYNHASPNNPIPNQRLQILCALTASHAMRSATRPISNSPYIQALLNTTINASCTCIPEMNNNQHVTESCCRLSALHVPLAMRRALVDHFRLTSDAISSPTQFDSHLSHSTRLWHSPEPSDSLLGADGQDWSELAGRYSLLMPSSPIQPLHRVPAGFAITQAHRAASETRLPTRIVVIVPNTKETHTALQTLKNKTNEPHVIAEIKDCSFQTCPFRVDQTSPYPPPLRAFKSADV